VHPTSFPGKYGMGDFGFEARTFIDFLERTHQSIWQILPLSPTGYGNSPYASYSAFAGNVYLISPDILHKKGLLSEKEIQEIQLPQKVEAEYEKAFENKDRVFKLAAQRFYENLSKEEEQAFNAFKKQNQHWLDDYVLFMACLLHYDKQPWNTWDEDLTKRKSSAIKSYRKKFKEEIDLQYWLQFEFYNQWMDLKKYANERGIRVVGDIPIFVDHNSADVWANPKYFEVDEEGNRQLIAGVPPDYFSKTGQLWGNPLYKWDELEKDDYSWWVDRFKHMFEMCDAIRVDHFRGFDAYWEVEAGQKTAEVGKWVEGPGEKLFDTILEKCGELPIIAEDLGFMTDGVRKLRDKYNFPGMKIIQFAFDSDSTNSFLPHNYSPNSVAYSGTHDNDTTLGWYQSAKDQERHRARIYTRSNGAKMNWEFIRLGMLSVSDQAIFPLQDYMNLDGDHRMNVPGTSSGNWLWRYTSDMLKAVDEEQIQHLIELSNRKIESNS
jgi:4-alpha-glucanotransferase